MLNSTLIAGCALGAAAVAIAAMLALQPGAQSGTTVLDDDAEAGRIDTAGAALASSDLELTDIFKLNEAGVVRVNVRSMLTNDTSGLGSGFVYDKRGHIITNEHVIGGSDRIIVTFLDGRSYVAELVGADKFTDIAVIRADADSELQPLMMGDSSSLQVGEEIAAIGNPYGLSGSLTAGIVSQIGRLLPVDDSLYSIPDAIQTDAAINPGNSGGPLLNMRGEVVGINTAIRTDTGSFTGVGFAVPSQTVLKVVPHLISGGEFKHPWMGVSGHDIDLEYARALNITDTRGFVVAAVIPDGPAERAGILGSTDTVEVDGVPYRVGGDIILKVDDVEVRKIDDILIHLQRSKLVGDEMSIQVLRDGSIIDLVMVLGERPLS